MGSAKLFDLNLQALKKFTLQFQQACANFDRLLGQNERLPGLKLAEIAAAQIVRVFAAQL